MICLMFLMQKNWGGGEGVLRNLENMKYWIWGLLKIKYEEKN